MRSKQHPEQMGNAPNAVTGQASLFPHVAQRGSYDSHRHPEGASNPAGRRLPTFHGVSLPRTSPVVLPGCPPGRRRQGSRAAVCLQPSGHFLLCSMNVAVAVLIPPFCLILSKKIKNKNVFLPRPCVDPVCSRNPTLKNCKALAGSSALSSSVGSTISKLIRQNTLAPSRVYAAAQASLYSKG